MTPHVRTLTARVSPPGRTDWAKRRGQSYASVLVDMALLN
jgi:hypothetical protein